MTLGRAAARPAATRKRRALRAVVVGLALLLGSAAAGLAGESWLAHGIVTAPNAGRTFTAGEDPRPEQYRPAGIDEQLRVELSDRDGFGTSCSVWIIEPEIEPRGTVLVLHGIRSDKTALTGLAQRVAREGFRAVLPDLPGQGRSSGDFLSYGVREARHLVGLLDDLARRQRLHDRLGVVGVSYGAATGIQLAAIDSRVRAVVAIAPFASLRAIVPVYVGRYLSIAGSLVPSSLIERAVDRAGQLARFDPDQASALAAISRTRAQVLLIHGAEDIHVPPSHSLLLQQAAPDHSQAIVLDGEDHESITADRSHTIAEQGMQWLQRWLSDARSENGSP